MVLNIKDRFNTSLPADLKKSNQRRQVYKACFSYVQPKKPSNPKLLHCSLEMAESLGLSKTDVESQRFLDMVTGAEVLENTNPYAMCYGGHQFGNWAGQLGDGRAICLSEVSHANKRWTLQLKGAGATPYSRTADGLAVLRSSIREHLCSEAMHHLGVPTTRSLSLALSGDNVLRDIMYNGNAAYEKGAIVCRVSPSFIRFGSFEIFASRQDTETLKALADYTIREFHPHIPQGTKEGYVQFLNEVANSTLEMIIHWQRVGFVHGVMNTDNMSIHGLTIDYGPYGWLEGYDPYWTPNTTDRQYRRYRFGNQPQMALWNLFQLANSLFPLIQDTKPLEEVLESYNSTFQVKYLKMMRQKIGLNKVLDQDNKLIFDLKKNLQLTETDMTIFFRNLSNMSKDVKPETSAWMDTLKDAFYNREELKDSIKDEWDKWFTAYVFRLNEEEDLDKKRKENMNGVNPKYVLRNYMAQMAINEADNDSYNLIDELYTMLKNPYAEQEHYEKWFAKRPEWARHKVGCSMLSCSS